MRWVSHHSHYLLTHLLVTGGNTTGHFQKKKKSKDHILCVKIKIKMLKVSFLFVGETKNLKTFLKYLFFLFFSKLGEILYYLLHAETMVEVKREGSC